MFQTTRAGILLSFSSIALLSACGGGEDSGTAPSPYLPGFAAPTPIDIAKLTIGFAIDPNVATNLANLLATARYQNTSAGIALINNIYGENIPGNATQDPLRTGGAAFAHATGLTGAGQLIAFSDEHVSVNHETIGVGRLDVMSNVTTGDHGTSVVSVAMGNSANFVGTAPGATGIYGTAFSTYNQLTEIGIAALAQHAVAWNNSWGFVGLLPDQASFNIAFGGPDGQAYMTALQNYAAEGVVVFAVDNFDTGGAGLMDGLPLLFNFLEEGWITVANGVPTFAGAVVSSVYLLSSPCYESARWCIVADGSWNAATGSASEYQVTTGSSFAAPQVSGALALLAQAFPGLTPHELRIRLLASAEDDFFIADDTVELAEGFFKGYSVIYGHGYLDIEAALRPIGGTTLKLSKGTVIPTNAPVLLTGSAFGDAVEVALAETKVAVRDALNAGFAMRGDALATGARPGSQAGALLARSLSSNLADDRQKSPSALADPFAALTGPVMTMSVPDATSTVAFLLPQGGSDALGFTLTRLLTDGPTRVELGLKLARDNGHLMSLDGNDAAMMASVALGITQDLGGKAFISVSGEMGLTDLGGATALSNSTSARFDALKLTAGRDDVFNKGDRISIGVGMPVAIASGETVLELPVYREGASMSFENVVLDLAPQDRQMDLEATYQTALSDGLEMKLSLIHSENFGNRAGVTDTGGALAFSFRF